MEDIIDIIVTETTNLITITSSGSDEVIDVNIIDNREDIVLNVTPSVVEININSLVGNFGVNWGQIGGTLTNQTDLNTVLGLKADLVGGLVPSSQLPSFVDDIIEVATFGALPVTGEQGKIYVVLATNLIYRWSGSAYIEIKDSSAVWGAITGTLSSQVDLQNALNLLVPYTGATTNVNLGSNNLTVNNIFDGFSSVTASGTQIVLTVASVPSYLVNGSGGQTIKLPDATTLPKGAVYIFNNNQSSGAITVNNNSNTLIVSIPSGGYAQVELTDNSIAAGSWDRHFQAPSNVSWSTNTFDYAGSITSATWNGVAVAINRGGTGATTSGAALTNLGAQAQLNGTGFVKASGTTISYDNSTYLTTSAASSTYLPLAGGTLTGALNGTSVSLSSSITASALFVTGMTAGSGAIYHTGSRLTFANYNPSGTLHFEVNGGVGALTLNSDKSATFENSITATSFIKTSGTSAQFLKADGSVDTSTYALDSAVVHLTGLETITGLKYFFAGSKHDLLFVSETVGYASQAGYSHFKANTNHVEFINSTNTKATKFIHGNAAYEFTMPNSSGTIALTSNLSAYLPLSGGTLSGALSGTSATFSGQIASQSTALSGVAITIQATSTNAVPIAITNRNSNKRFDLIIDVNAVDDGFFGIYDRTVGAFRQVITSAGNVLINGTSSTSSVALLQVFGSTTASTNNGQLRVNDSVTTSKTLSIGVDGANNLAFLQSFQDGVAYRSLILNGLGGNVGIGTTAPGYKLSVVGPNGGNGISWTDNANNTGYLGIRGGSAASIGADNNLVFETAATERMRITSDGIIQLSTTASIPTTNNSIYSYSGNGYLYIQGGSTGLGLSASGSRNNIIYVNETSNFIRFDVNSAERMRITSGGNVGINTTGSSSIKLIVCGQDGGSSNYAFVAADNLGNTRFGVRNDGAIYAPGVYNFTTSSVANVVVFSDGSMQRSTVSSARFKDNITDWNASGLNTILALKPKEFTYKKDYYRYSDKKFLGLIAEEVAEVSSYLADFANEDGSGQVENVRYANIVVPLIKAVQELEAKIKILENK